MPIGTSDGRGGSSSPLGLAGCDLITGNTPEASTIVISPSGIAFDAIGATATLSAEVRDQDNRILRNEVVTWSSSDSNVATISPAGLLTAVTNGAAAITAEAGAASESVNLSVTQLATMLEKVSGDGQLGPAGELLAEPLVVRAHDRLGNPAIDVPVEFQIMAGGGARPPPKRRRTCRGGPLPLGPSVRPPARRRPFGVSSVLASGRG